MHNRTFWEYGAAVKHPKLTELEVSWLTALAEEGPTHGVPKEIRGRLALYKLIEETPRGWSITALGREALIEPRPVGSQDDSEKPSQRSPHGTRRWKSRNTSWIR